MANMLDPFGTKLISRRPDGAVAGVWGSYVKALNTNGYFNQYYVPPPPFNTTKHLLTHCENWDMLSPPCDDKYLPIPCHGAIEITLETEDTLVTGDPFDCTMAPLLWKGEVAQADVRATSTKKKERNEAEISMTITAAGNGRYGLVFLSSATGSVVDGCTICSNRVGGILHDADALNISGTFLGRDSCFDSPLGTQPFHVVRRFNELPGENVMQHAPSTILPGFEWVGSGTSGNQKIQWGAEGIFYGGISALDFGDDFVGDTNGALLEKASVGYAGKSAVEYEERQGNISFSFHGLEYVLIGSGPGASCRQSGYHGVNESTCAIAAQYVRPTYRPQAEVNTTSLVEIGWLDDSELLGGCIVPTYNSWDGNWAPAFNRAFFAETQIGYTHQVVCETRLQSRATTDNDTLVEPPSQTKTSARPGTKAVTTARTTRSSSAAIVAPIIVILLLIVGVGGVVAVRRSRRETEQAELVKFREAASNAARQYARNYRHLRQHSVINDDDTIDAVLVNPSSVERMHEIGKGRRTTVYAGTLKQNVTKMGKECIPGPVAIKELELSQAAGARRTAAVVSFLEEALLLRTFDHPNCLRIVGIVSTTNPFTVLTEYCMNGNLKVFLRACRPALAKPRARLTSELLCQIAGKVTNGMVFLSSKKIVHRELAAHSVLVGDTLDDVKISHFGRSKDVYLSDEYISTSSNTHSQVEFVRWMSPEAIRYQKFTYSSDVWSLGVVFYEIFSYVSTVYG
jgi:hypothetical protein